MLIPAEVYQHTTLVLERIAAIVLVFACAISATAVFLNFKLDIEERNENKKQEPTVQGPQEFYLNKARPTVSIIKLHLTAEEATDLRECIAYMLTRLTNLPDINTDRLFYIHQLIDSELGLKVGDPFRATAHTPSCKCLVCEKVRERTKFAVSNRQAV